MLIDITDEYTSRGVREVLVNRNAHIGRLGIIIFIYAISDTYSKELQVQIIFTSNTTRG